MATRKTTRHGATTSTRRTTSAKGSARGSSSRTPSSRNPAPRRRTASRTTPRTAPQRTPKAKTSRRARPSTRRVWLLPAALLLTVVALGWVFYAPLKIQYQESREQQRLQAELDGLKARNDALSAQVERLRTPEGVEEVARQTLGMVKQGEHAYVVLDSGEDESATAPATDARQEGDIWHDLLDLIFGVR